MVRFSRNIKTLISVVLAASLASSFTFTAGAVTKKAENDEIVLAAESAACTGKYNLKNDYDGKKGISIYSGEESAVSWNFNANAGKYTVTVVYHTEQGSGIDIQRSLKVNGAYPVDSAAEFHLHRCWTDVKKENGKFLTDTYGNELRPSQTERFCWMTQVLRDYVGYDSSPITVTLKDGANTISLGYIEEPVIIGELRLQPTEELKSYAEISKQYAQKGYRNVCDKQIVCEGENSAFKTDPVLYPGSDRTNADVSSNNPYLQIINKIGGTAWNTGGQKIAWNIEAPESGLYRITFKVRKNSSKGLNAYRRLYIDGSVPFAEADALAFPFMNEWTNQTLGDKNGDWLFYLEKGRHEIALEATYGEMSKILEDTKNSLNRMNTVYRRILVVTGTEPDLNRNYHFDEIMPDVVEQISEEYKTINEIFERALAISGEKGESFTSLDATMRTLKNMVKDSSEIAKNLSDFKTNIGSLGTWLNTVGSQYIEIDRLYVDTPDLTLPSAQKPFFARLWFGIRSLIASYVIDYNSIGDNGTRDKNCDSVSVWITDGREQYQALKALVNNDFIPNRKIPVELKLVSAGILLPSIVAGVAPDVNIGTTDVVNLALRNAVVDLSQFSDFEDIVNECFSPEETVPFRFNGGVYAMPETVTFPVLFYRKDILNELSLDIPQTWGDVTRMISVLNKNNMTFGLGTDLLTYFMFLSQNGVALYSDSGSKCTFGSEDGVRAFRTWTNYFLNYSLPLSFDFQNRFRTGEMPVGIAAYSTYNTLAVAAPEINGLWDFTLVPGTQKEDGTVDHTGYMSTTGCVIISQTKLKEEAWEFVKWWISADSQLSYGLELESIMGPSSRYSTANMKAFSSLPWKTSQRSVLLEQFNNCKAVPDVPGGYLTARNVQYAFRKVVLQDADAKDTLLEYISTINAELVGKRTEYGLSVDE